MAACELPFVEHGDLVITENGFQVEMICHDGYFLVDGDSLRICHPHNSSWTGVTPLCILTPGLSSAIIMLLIAGPIIIFFCVCFMVDFHFYKRRKQSLREQQGMVYYRELRRVGMGTLSFGESFETVTPPVSTFSSVRRKMNRFRTLIKFLIVRRNSESKGEEDEQQTQQETEEDGQQTQQETELNKSFSSESHMETIPESNIPVQVYQPHIRHKNQDEQQHGSLQEEKHKLDIDDNSETEDMQYILRRLDSQNKSMPKKNDLIIQVPVYDSSDNMINQLPASKSPLPSILQIQVAEMRRQSYAVQHNPKVQLTYPTTI